MCQSASRMFKYTGFTTLRRGKGASLARRDNDDYQPMKSLLVLTGNFMR